MNEATAVPKRKPWLKIILITLLVLLLALVGLWWWNNRPIQPVVLTTQEKQIVAEKVEAIQMPEAIQKPEEPKYEKGKKEIVLTERELNGLLNENTTLGKSVSFELATNAVHARVEMDLDKDLPLLGGRHLKARARFLVKGETGKPAFVLDDLTIWGISLPNEWLGGLKGHDLLGEVLGTKDGHIAGVEEFKVEPGKLVVRLKE